MCDFREEGSPFYNKNKGSKSTPQPMWDVDLHICQKTTASIREKSNTTKLRPNASVIGSFPSNWRNRLRCQARDQGHSEM